jgi:hypothetical protein
VLTVFVMAFMSLLAIGELVCCRCGCAGGWICSPQRRSQRTDCKWGYWSSLTQLWTGQGDVVSSDYWTNLISWFPTNAWTVTKIMRWTDPSKLVLNITYRVSQEERSILWEVTVSVILNKILPECWRFLLGHSVDLNDSNKMYATWNMRPNNIQFVTALGTKIEVFNQIVHMLWESR